ncbi:SnoaL-like domain-containing protein [Streptomyces sp. 2224.1]|nr:SnoaL-like protein [Streptomyces sp. 2321.6]SDR57047.1 SnoaL-like domain-containing protein [Streptomyces sp. KS_16]SEB91539.1 SnoaL-like domain-containing protein [Streptomyces sp. 2133.1]SED34620.1 SnoaL-like domain-containing protein [Streptomyces sp. 2224.1]SEF12283.1 SnoaL-like domain-containing protein [Streptomyces sp. 2112.3]SNC62520.1 SnoaL-like domain-containing protein [Streptomyces sp. 2114.4]
MPKTEMMTQRAEHSTVMDRLALDDLITGYAIAVDDGDWPGYRALFTPDGRADYRSAGGIEGGVDEITAWLGEMLQHFAIRQHLIVNRRITLVRLDGASGDSATVQADYFNPMRLAGPATEGGGGPTAPNYTCAGRYEFTARRTADGWRLTGVVVHEKWREVWVDGE